MLIKKKYLAKTNICYLWMRVQTFAWRQMPSSFPDALVLKVRVERVDLSPNFQDALSQDKQNDRPLRINDIPLLGSSLELCLPVGDEL